MLVRFFSERTGGVKFFQELDRAKQNPAVNLGLLEVMHACLSLGFEGVYRASGGAGRACRASAATSTRRSAARSPRRSRICRRIGAARTSRLSPTASTCRSGRSRRSPASFCSASISCLRNLLSGQAEALALKMARLHPDTEITIARETAVKPPPDPPPANSTQLERIRAALADEILAGKVDADQTGDLDHHPHRQCRAVSLGRREGQRFLRADRRQDRRGARQGAGRHPRRRLYRHRPDQDRSLSLELGAFGGARQIGRGVSKPSLRNPIGSTVSGKGSDNPVAPNDTSRTKRRTGGWKSRFRAPTDQARRTFRGGAGVGVYR